MIHPRVARLALAWWLIPTVLILSQSQPTQADPPAQAKAADEPVPGQFFQIGEPITSESIAKVRASARQLIDRSASVGKEPVLVFEFLPNETGDPTSPYAAQELADLISKGLSGARHRVAFVPKPLKGFAVLAALACDEIVMGNESSIGPIAVDGQDYDPALLREPIRVLSIRKGYDPDLLLGMLERETDLRAVRTADKQLHFVLSTNLPDFKKTHQVVDDLPAWEGGQRGVLNASRARQMGFAKLIADTPAEVASAYHLSGQAAANDPTLGQAIKPVWIEIHGPIDPVKQSYLRRRIEQARQEGVNLVFFQINSMGGLITAADGVADMIAGIKDMKTVAFIDDRAMGVAALTALACNDIVFRKGALMGDVHQLLTGRHGRAEELDEIQIKSLVRRAANLAEQQGHPVAVARAMVDPEATVVEARDTKTGAQAFVLQTDVDAEPGRFTDPEVRKESGTVLTVKGEEAPTYGLGRVVNTVDDFKGLYGFRGKEIRVDGPTWVDSLVTILTDPFVSWLLLVVGLFMLVLELKLPGIGLPAITSALAFLLFFWSHYLSGTADQLEIIIFLVGMICLALELFVFPGFGIFGMSGILLVLTSIVMASHTFVWPTQEYEYREMGYTLLQVTIAMIAVGGGAVVLARYFPSLPLFNRLVLKPEPWTGVDSPVDASGKATMDGYDSLTFLIGETGRTTTVLRPTGKARFGEMLVDVTADGFYIEPDSLVEVVDVQGSRVIVKRMDV